MPLTAGLMIRAAPPPPPPGTWLLEDFSTYTSTANMKTNPRGIYSSWDPASDGNENFNISQIVLDQTTGVNINGYSLTKSMRYDFPDRSADIAGRCGDYPIGVNLNLPTSEKEIWVEVYAKFQANFTTSAPSGWNCNSNPEYKFIHGRTHGGSRFNLNSGTYPSHGWTWGIPFDEQGAGGIPAGVISGGDAVWDGQWHQYRLHMKVSSVTDVADGSAQFYLDGTLIKSFAAAVINDTDIYGIALGRNMNQGPSTPMSVWWGRVQVWNTDPLWTSGLLGSLLAFPFAQGYKVNSTLFGGRVLGGGEVRKVTNLNDSGAGSLRAALTSVGPADVVFEVAGVIPLATTLTVGTMGVDTNITVWGETAPSPGITVSEIDAFPYTGGNPAFVVSGNNIIFRHLRFRMARALDGTTFQQVILASTFTGSRRIIFANCSFAYNADEMFGFAENSPIADITSYRCIHGPGSGTQCKAMLLTGNTSNTAPGQVAVIQSFYPLTFDRCPEFHGGSKLALYNNYIYGCGHGAGGVLCGNGYWSTAVGDTAITPCRVSVRGNVYESNADVNWPFLNFANNLGNPTPHNQSYFDDNTGFSRCVQTAIVDVMTNETDLTMTLPEVSTVIASSGVKAFVLARVGARPLDRDTVDSGSVTNAQNGTGARNLGAPPAYSLGTASRALSIPSDWSAAAVGEATGWRVLDKWIYQNYTLAVES